MPAQAASFHHYLGDVLTVVNENGPEARFKYCLSPSSATGFALASFTEKVALKLGMILQLHLNLTIVVNGGVGVTSAFVTLTDGSNHCLLAGSWKQYPQDEIHSDAAPKWFTQSGTELEIWSQLFRESGRSAVDTQHYIVPDLQNDNRYRLLSSVAGAPFLKFFASFPILNSVGIRIGSIIILDAAARPELLALDLSLLQQTAHQCVMQLDLVREAEVRHKILAYNNAINSFIDRQFAAAEHYENPQPFKESDSMQHRQASHIHETSHGKKADNQASVEERSAINVADTITDASPAPKDESPYRKIFRQAAEHLREALDVDGVVFVDGFSGMHGELQAVPQPHQELGRELVQRPRKKQAVERFESQKVTQSTPSSKQDPQSPASTSPESDDSAYRTFTSADYQKVLLKDRAAEILGTSLRTATTPLCTVSLAETTMGLAHIHEGFVQQLMDNYPEGRIWYFDDNQKPYSFDDDVPVDAVSKSDAAQFALAFPQMRQLIFFPMVDLNTRKRLAICCIWTLRNSPVFSAAADLVSLKAFLHVVEGEISRVDIASALKQREAFVSSVSHELRTPLHGVLGALEFLEETTLDDFQRGLANTIKNCGSTLHQTLSNILSYARINEFERRKNRPSQRLPPSSSWVLSDKEEHTQTAEDFQDLLTSTNLASLVEEVVEVAESGYTYLSGSGLDSNVDRLILTLDVDYHDNWDFLAEPGALRRIFMNIIGNALKYTSQGFVSVSLSIKEDQEDGPSGSGTDKFTKLVAFTVKDSGKGMSSDFIQNHLFIPFSQEHATASEGVGLGMSIVKSLVGLLGGQINVQSQPGKGTEFAVICPMEADRHASSAANVASQQQAQIITMIRGKRLRAVLVGLSELLQQTLRHYLINWFKVEVISDEHLKQSGSQPSLVIVDEAIIHDTDTMSTLKSVYDQHSALLVVSKPLRAPRHSVEGKVSFRIWETLHRPLVPSKITRALQVCLQKLEHDPAIAPKLSRSSKSEAIAAALQPRTTASPQKLPWTTTPITEAVPHVMKYDLATSMNIPTGTAPAEDPPSEFSEGPSSLRQKPDVLLVDDNVINIKLLQTFMAKYDVPSIVTAESGQDAVTAVKQRTNPFDIIFMGELRKITIGSNVETMELLSYNPPPSSSLDVTCSSLTCTRPLNAGNGRL
jgi:signal transduction histidine kinase